MLFLFWFPFILRRVICCVSKALAKSIYLCTVLNRCYFNTILRHFRKPDFMFIQVYYLQMYIYILWLHETCKRSFKGITSYCHCVVTVSFLIRHVVCGRHIKLNVSIIFYKKLLHANKCRSKNKCTKYVKYARDASSILDKQSFPENNKRLVCA